MEKCFKNTQNKNFKKRIKKNTQNKTVITIIFDGKQAYGYASLERMPI
jgi:hypothetical protein